VIYILNKRLPVCIAVFAVEQNYLSLMQKYESGSGWPSFFEAVEEGKSGRNPGQFSWYDSHRNSM
jgi:peptide methionine sulfoxide reductase MsrB